MAPQEKSEPKNIFDDEFMVPNLKDIKAVPKDLTDDVNFKPRWVPHRVLIMTGLQLSGIYGAYLAITAAQWKTNVFAFLLYVCSMLGITAGVHRLWAHRSYQAKWPMRLILAFFNTIAYEESIFDWARDHRVHHKYSDTQADPHNARRGFFHSHMGWLMQRKHPLVIEKGRKIDVSDLWNDPIVYYQRKYYIPLTILCCFVMPTLVPYYYWGESLWNAYFVAGAFRLIFNWHLTWLVNSAAHYWGRRPYDTGVFPRENRFVSLGAHGEGFHNYHHTFPWDYATSELGYEINLARIFIDSCAAIGWAYNRKTTSPAMIKARKQRTGDVKEMGPYGPHN